MGVPGLLQLLKPVTRKVLRSSRAPELRAFWVATRWRCGPQLVIEAFSFGVFAKDISYFILHIENTSSFQNIQ